MYMKVTITALNINILTVVHTNNYIFEIIPLQSDLLQISRLVMSTAHHLEPLTQIAWLLVFSMQRHAGRAPGCTTKHPIQVNS